MRNQIIQSFTLLVVFITRGYDPMATINSALAPLRVFLWDTLSHKVLTSALMLLLLGYICHAMWNSLNRFFLSLPLHIKPLLIHMFLLIPLPLHHHLPLLFLSLIGHIFWYKPRVLILRLIQSCLHHQHMLSPSHCCD